MSIVEAQTTMTVEEFLALPDDGVRRELIRGELREYGMTVRNRYHAATETRIGWALTSWMFTRPEPRGTVASGEVGFRLRGTRESVVGIDVAFATPEQVQSDSEGTLFDGPPLLAVEILSPSDKKKDFTDKLALYLDSGTSVVWEVDPDLQVVRVHRRGREPEMFTLSSELTCEPELPGFRVPLSLLFLA